MARGSVCFLLSLCLVRKVLPSYAPQALQQYLHLTGIPHTPQTVTLPAPNNQIINQVPNLQPTNLPRPTTGLPSLSALALPNLVSNLQKLPSQPKSPEVKSANPSSIDANLLNNLAIALQLLIVSNILNTPPPDSTVAKPVKEVACGTEMKQPYYTQYQSSMPNSNFVSASSFGEPNLAQGYKPTRNNMALMSPYEALSPNSPYSDPILSQYGSINSRQDFQSPYSMIDKDLFSMTDLF